MEQIEEIGDTLVFPRPGRLRVSDDRFQFDFQFDSALFSIRFRIAISTRRRARSQATEKPPKIPNATSLQSLPPSQ
jgi:hypothetical protein